MTLFRRTNTPMSGNAHDRRVADRRAQRRTRHVNVVDEIMEDYLRNQQQQAQLQGTGIQQAINDHMRLVNPNTFGGLRSALTIQDEVEPNMSSEEIDRILREHLVGTGQAFAYTTAPTQPQSHQGGYDLVHKKQ